MIRPGPEYRREAFHAGLAALGYAVKTNRPQAFAPGDLLVIWNRYGDMHLLAAQAEKAGVPVIVAENGYFLRPHFGGQHYALARTGHNGSGAWPAGGGERWAALGIELAPWRDKGDHILVCPNRAFGRPGYIMPMDWPQRVVERLQRITRRPVRLRSHPGNVEPKRPLNDALSNCWAMVIWASSAGVHGLVAGIPVICEGPAWIAKGATGADIKTVDAPVMPERLPVFERLAWAQWTMAEIASGEPFARLIAL